MQVIDHIFISSTGEVAMDLCGLDCSVLKVINKNQNNVKSLLEKQEHLQKKTLAMIIFLDEE